MFPWIIVSVFTLRPFDLKDAVAEPLAINGDTTDGTFVNLLPSPWKEPEKDPLNSSKDSFFANPLLPSESETIIAGFVNNDAEKSGTPKFGSAWDKSQNWYLSDVTFFGLTTLTLPVNRLLIAISSC